MISVTFPLIFAVLVVVCGADEPGHKEHVPLRSESSKLNQPHSEHLDHEAVLGSEKLATEFDDLSPEESKRRLRVLAKRMDLDGDGFVTEFELNNWVYNSLTSLDKEETTQRFNEIDRNGNGVITWEEYLDEAFGVTDPDQIKDGEDAKLMIEDKKYFEAADADHNGELSADEFNAFLNPEHHSGMHDTLVENTLVEKDKNKDGKIDLKEYMGEIHDQPTSEWFATEKTRFTDDYDKNKDGYLEGEELRAWLIPDLRETAKQEAEHLLMSADENQDEKLSIDEIVNAHKLFVGSEATNFGETLLDIPHDEL